MEEVTIKDVNELKKFEKNTNLYQKSVKMDVIN
jgi:hypothetical protein